MDVLFPAAAAPGTSLGNPLSAYYTTQMFPRNPWAILPFDGKVFLTGGDSSNPAAGSYAIYSYDPATDAWTQEYVTQDEVSFQLRIWGSDLWSVGWDPNLDDTARLYVRESGVWRTLAVGPATGHTYDFVQWAADDWWFSSGGGFWRSTDQGATWTLGPTAGAMGSLGYGIFFTLDGELYSQVVTFPVSTERVFHYLGDGVWEHVTTDLWASFHARYGFYPVPKPPTQHVGDYLFYLAEVSDPDPVELYRVTALDAAQRVMLGEGGASKPRFLYWDEAHGRLYVLTSTKTDDPTIWLTELWWTTDGIAFTLAFRAHTPALARCFCVVGTQLYLGLGGWAPGPNGFEHFHEGLPTDWFQDGGTKPANVGFNDSLVPAETGDIWRFNLGAGMGELYAIYAPDVTVYAVEENSSGQAWNGSAFEDQDDLNWASYVSPMTARFSGSSEYGGAARTSLSTRYVYYYQVGGSPAAPPVDQVVGIGGPSSGGGLPGGGNRTITFQVTRSDTAAAVVGATVTVKQGATTVAWGYTNGSGEMLFGLNDGDYTYTVTAGSGYVPQTDVSFTVAADASVPVSLDVQTPSPPATPGLCTVAFTVRNPVGGALVAGATVTAQLVGHNVCADDTLLTRQIGTGTTNGAGYVELQLVRHDFVVKGKGVYRFQATDPNGLLFFDFIAVVPAQDTATMADLVRE